MADQSRDTVVCNLISLINSPFNSGLSLFLTDYCVSSELNIKFIFPVWEFITRCITAARFVKLNIAAILPLIICFL